jgi:rSAM/selenodomain-associated transferase 2
MTISVVIPTLNEERSLPATLTRAAESGVDEVIVVDGGSTDHTREVVLAFAPAQGQSRQHSASSFQLSPPDVHLPALSPQHSVLRQAQDPTRLSSSQAEPCRGAPSTVVLLTATPGRAPQMNAGAAASRGQILLFLHADTLLPPDARSAIEKALEDPAYVGGRFDVRFERDSGLGRLIGCLINLRSRWTGIATGDQAIFVRRSVFEWLGGFSDIPIMEDVDLTQRLKRIGRMAALRLQVVTSFRRWDACGPIRTIALMWVLRFLYSVGLSPGTLSRFYGTAR